MQPAFVIYSLEVVKQFFDVYAMQNTKLWIKIADEKSLNLSIFILGKHTYTDH